MSRAIALSAIRAIHVHVGDHFTARISGTVRVIRIEERLQSCVWRCTNTETGREVILCLSDLISAAHAPAPRRDVRMLQANDRDEQMEVQ